MSDLTERFEKVVLADGRAVLYRADCLDVLPRLPEVDAVIADSPYSSGGLYRGDRAKSVPDKYVQGGTGIERMGFVGDGMDARSWVWWSVEWMRRARLREGGYILTFSDWRQVPATTDAMQWANYIWRGIIAWDKGLGSRAPHKGYFRHQAEYVVWGTAGKCPVAEHAGPFPGAFSFPVLQKDKHHITGKPTALMRELVKCVPEGATILDPFAGSGTTGVAALKEGRSFIGVEIDEQHFATACARIADFWEKHGCSG